jgi:adhesin/invasin
LLFSTTVNGSPAAQTVDVSNTTGSGSVGFTVATATSSGGNWLSVSTTTDTTPVTLSVSVNTTNLAQGGYNGTITLKPLSSANATNSQVVIQVGLAISAPAVEPGGVVNAAIFSTSISPGSIISLFGVNLATSTVSAPSTPLPTTLGGTQVLVNGVAAPLFYVSPTQVNAQLPDGISGTVTITVISGTITGVTTTVQVTSFSPGIFAVAGAQGQIGAPNSQGAILNSDLTPNSSTNPAASGSVIVIYATGLGPTTPPLAAGQPGSSSAPYNTLANPVTVSVNGQSAAVSFEGAAPGFVGLFQINASIPAGTPPGNSVPVQLSVLGVSSNAVTICVK